MHKIMAIDDRADNLALLEFFIVKMGHQFFGFTSPVQAFDAVVAIQPEVILMDLLLDDTTNGVELANAIKTNINPHIKIVAITAATLQFPESKIMAAGFDGYLPKPHPIPKLKATVNLFLDQIPHDRIEQHASS